MSDDAAAPVLIETGGVERLDDVAHLWALLNELHAAVSPHFADQFPLRRFEHRRAELARKASEDTLLVVTAHREGESRAEGYCVCTIDATTGVGEVDSILVGESLRGCGVGERLMQAATAWFDARGVFERIVTVAVGNEAAFPFYERFGFYPRTTVLRWRAEPADE